MTKHFSQNDVLTISDNNDNNYLEPHEAALPAITQKNTAIHFELLKMEVHIY